MKTDPDCGIEGHYAWTCVRRWSWLPFPWLRWRVTCMECNLKRKVSK